ncbi:hypothetical protein SUGI_0861390 [Cryptomeria japonica]|nr:hypothetical protein SUGI_0861390 [Cryptomeria japonica]
MVAILLNSRLIKPLVAGWEAKVEVVIMAVVVGVGCVVEVAVVRVVVVGVDMVGVVVAAGILRALLGLPHPLLLGLRHSHIFKF